MPMDLVTGASGFIGSHVAEHLLSRGRVVRVLLRPGSSLRWLPQGVEVFRLGQWTADALRPVIAGVDRVYHVAGVTHAANPEDFHSFHVTSTEALLSACCSAGTVSRVVVFSSLAAAGPSRTGQPLRETDAPAPVSWYGQSKLAQEQVALSHAGRLPVVIVRPPAVYGPRDRDFLPLFRMARLGLLPVPARGTQSLTYVSDVVAGAWAAAQAPATPGSLYFISSREIVTWPGLARVLERAMGRSIRVIPIPRLALNILGPGCRLAGRLGARNVPLDRNKLMEARFPHWTCSPRRAECELLFRPAVDLSEGIAHTLQWYRDKGWL